MHPASRRKGSIVDRLSGKVSKESVSYRPAHGESETKISCAECEYYLYPGQPESTCAKVAGMVEGRDVCDLFETSENSSTRSGQGVSVEISLNVQP